MTPIRVAARGLSSAVWDETLEDPDALKSRLEEACARGAQRALYMFAADLSEPWLPTAIRTVADDRRLQPAVIVGARVVPMRDRLELLRASGLRELYVTLLGASSRTHDARFGQEGSWKQALGIVAAGRAYLNRVRIGLHLPLSTDTVNELPGILQLMAKATIANLLLWDDGSLSAPDALRALDFVATTADRAGVQVVAEGFSRTRHLRLPPATTPAFCSATVVDLLQEGIPLPSARKGLLSIGQGRWAAPDAPRLAQLSFELAARGFPFVDLPACLGGAPAARGVIDVIKSDSCRRCPNDANCAGAPKHLADLPDLKEALRPLEYWHPAPSSPRVLVLCPVVTDALYGSTFFGLARRLAARGAQVDVVSPWEKHFGITDAFGIQQPTGSPPESVVERFVAEGDLAPYDLIVTPDLPVGLALIKSGRLAEKTRLAATDIHMLWGMDDWTKAFCPSSR